MSTSRGLRTSRRAGVVLDLILGFGIVVVSAFLLYHVGLTFHTILHGAERFFGI